MRVKTISTVPLSDINCVEEDTVIFPLNQLPDRYFSCCLNIPFYVIIASYLTFESFKSLYIVQIATKNGKEEKLEMIVKRLVLHRHYSKL